MMTPRQCLLQLLLPLLLIPQTRLHAEEPRGNATGIGNTKLAPVQSLIERVAPGRGQEFVVEAIPAAEGRGVFELESRGTKVAVRGDSPLSVAVGFNWYLKYYPEIRS